MDTIVRVKSVGVLGLSSKITTFVIDIELDGGKLKIEDRDGSVNLNNSYK